MADVNISKVYLLNTPLENDYKHTLYFNSKESQQAYFESRIVKSYTDFSYQRKDHFIRVPEHFDNLQNVNYVMYQNSAYSNKWFYAFVVDLKYIDDGRTDVYIETDYIQTWLFDYTVKPSFVEREHVSDDTVGKHTIPENLETGEFVCNELSRDNELGELVYVMVTTEFTPGSDASEQGDKPLATNYGGIFMAGGSYVFKDMRSLVQVLSLFDNAGKGEAIQCVYMIPKKLLSWDEASNYYNGVAEPVKYEHKFTKQTTLNGYTPRNKKLLTYPYNYILNSNNNGSSNILQYEHFSGDECVFEIAGCPVIGGSIKCAPKNYKGIERFQEEGILCGKFPTLSWSQDLFTNWLTQHALNLNIGIASSGLSVLAGTGLMLTGGGATVGGSMVLGGVMGITNSLAQIHKQEFTPNSAKGNINGGDINTAYNMNKFYFYKMSIKKEYAEVIDKYFDMFGYKVNIVKTPNTHHRSRWWYTKTIDVNIDGAIPNKDMNVIKACYNNGITFWRNANEIQNYSLSNGISNIA